MPARFDCDLLVIGAGPVGASLALLAAREGLSVIAADKADEIYPLPRAAHIDHEIVRVFQAVGAADDIMATSKVAARYDFLTASGEVLLSFDTTGVRSPSGWPASNMIHQPSLEAALRKQIAVSDTATLKVGWELLALDHSDDGVAARFDTRDGEQTLRARYLVGCDGARSVVRDLSGIGLDDLQFDEPWLVIDTIVVDEARLPDLNLQICDPARPTTCVQMGAGRHRWEFMMLPGETARQVTDDAFIKRLLKPWNVEGAVVLERSAVYRFHALVAETWRKDRVFLAGDAAHQTPPFAGQGLCAGVRDAANLAWKLGAVLRGEAQPTLLDTYQSEREPHVRSAIALALMMGRTVCITDPAAAAERDAAMLAQRKSGAPSGGGLGGPPLANGCLLEGSPGAGELFPQPWATEGGAVSRFDDVAGPGPWLITRKAAPNAASLNALSLEDPRLAPFAAEIAAWLDRKEADSVLVRPDRYVFGTGKPDALAASWAGVMKRSGG
jgi:3-(3-hydroxy-phenyl)propionate hydroxylase